MSLMFGIGHSAGAACQNNIRCWKPTPIGGATAVGANPPLNGCLFCVRFPQSSTRAIPCDSGK
jgi:hypothetical protein